MLNTSFDLGVSVSELLICVVNLIYTFIQGRTDKTQNKIFITMLCILSINAVNGIISAVYGSFDYSHAYSIIALSRSNYVYFVTHTALCPMFFYYVSNVSRVSIRFDNLKNYLIFIPFLITEIMALTNPLTHWVWSFDSNMEFQRESGEIVIYLTALFYYVFGFFILISSWGVISKKRKVALAFFFILVAIGVLVQFIDKNLKVEILSEAVGLTGVMMSVENEEDRIDFGMGFYNRAAFSLDMGGNLRHNRKGYLVVLHINNYDVINRFAGNESSNILSEILSGYLMTLVKRYHIYVLDKDTFVFTLFDKKPKEVDAIVDKLAERLEKPWDYKDYNIQFNSTIMVGTFPYQLKTVSEMLYMIDNPIHSTKENNIFKGNDLDFIMRRQAVENAISRGFANDGFEVYYQPTYHINGKLHGAEALIRLHDQKMGNLFPDEFIPIAEQNGLVDDIDDFVLDEVCKFLKSGIPQKYGIDNINVNLSVLQCMKPGFVENVNHIVEKHGIKKNHINFEITESIAADDYGILANVIKSLKEDGFLFSMDDYGTGYSNVSAVFSLNLDVVKVDKSLLWGAEKSGLGMIILENTIRMIKQMDKLILVEGVETLDQIELLKKLKVDYLQGFYYSKPIPKDEFVKLICKYSTYSS